MKKIFFFLGLFIALILPNNIYAQSTKADLDVTYIEISPKYNRYRFIDEGIDRIPVLAPIPGDPDNDPTNDKHWPDPGENVTITAHFKNKGKITARKFAYKLFIDNVVKKQGTIQNLSLNQENTVSYVWPWPNNLEDHTVTFSIDTNNQISEFNENNNSLTEYTNSLSYSIWVEEKLYTMFNQKLNSVNSYSFEDWLHWQVNELKRQLVNSRYPLTPDGIKERIRIDRIIVIPYVSYDLNNWIQAMDNDQYKWQTDGRWQFVSGRNTLAEKQIEWNNYLNTYINRLDYGLTHELVHQLGVIDNYRFNKANTEPNNLIEVTDKNGNLANAPWPYECQGLMGGDSAKMEGICIGSNMEDHAIIPLKLNFHFRRGFYGEYLFDIPENNFLKILDVNGNPIASASVSLYQKSRDTEIIDNIPEHEGITDENGQFFLNNRPVTPVTTITGHSLRNNPFGPISVVGENCSFFVKINYNGNEEFQWLTIRPFNLAFWNGQTTENIIPIKTNFTVQ